MTKQMKNCIDVKNSNVCATSNSTKTEPAQKARKLNGKEAVKPPVITLSLTGVHSNRLLFAYRKAFYEFLVELTKGHIFADLRLKKKFEAADYLYPEDARALRGLTVTIK